jgi:DNA-binding IclR family transcriptional regulator
MAESGGDVRERILEYLRAGDGNTIREVAEFAKICPSQALRWLHVLEVEGAVEFLVMRGLWRLCARDL